MRIVITFIAALMLCSCATRARQSIAISISPASVRGVPREEVAAARAALATELNKRGFDVIRDQKGADYVLHTYYALVARHPSIGELVEVRKERNILKERPFTSQDSLRVSPRITDDISGTEPPP